MVGVELDGAMYPVKKSVIGSDCWFVGEKCCVLFFVLWCGCNNMVPLIVVNKWINTEITK